MKILAKWTVEDYHRMIATGVLCDRRVELLQGEIVEMTPEDPFHYFLSDRGSDYLKHLLQGKAKVRLDGSITLSNSEPEPDIAIVQLPESRYRDRHPYPEDIFWLIEVSDSTLLKDLQDKKAAYAAAGIPEYWVLDLKAGALIVFRQLNDAEYLSEQKFIEDIICPIAFPEVQVSVDRLLRGE